MAEKIYPDSTALPGAEQNTLIETNTEEGNSVNLAGSSETIIDIAKMVNIADFSNIMGLLQKIVQQKSN